MELFDFGDGNGPVPAHSHSKGGGMIADTAKVDETCYIGISAKVYGNAIVSDNVFINDKAEIYGEAVVKENAKVYGNAKVFGKAVVQGRARISGNAKVYDKAIVKDDALVFDDAEVFELANVINFAQVYHAAKIGGVAKIREYTKICGKCVATRNPIVVYVPIYDTTFNMKEITGTVTDYHVTFGCVSLPPSVWQEKGDIFLSRYQDDKEKNKTVLKIIDHFVKIHGCEDKQKVIDELPPLNVMIDDMLNNDLSWRTKKENG